MRDQELFLTNSQVFLILGAQIQTQGPLGFSKPLSILYLAHTIFTQNLQRPGSWTQALFFPGVSFQSRVIFSAILLLLEISFIVANILLTQPYFDSPVKSWVLGFTY